MFNWKLCSWVYGGKQRRAIIRVISKPLTPAQICKKSKQYNEKITINNTSDILRSFKKRGLAICLNEEARRGRLYKLTEVGEEIRTELLKE
jgi:DNA-binding MarR family transcriptional regulator